MEKEKQFRSILQFIEQKLFQIEDLTVKMMYNSVVDQLSTIPYFNWVGIYLLDNEKNQLVLDYYVGKPTEHTHIPVGKGVCGSAVADKTDKIIEDVTKEENYLACSLETRSEIVVLIEDEKDIIGQIDVDSDEVGAFDETDQEYLRQISDLIVDKLRS
ncbi:MAG: GAF domain-containing protein [Candidatus Heimdallarchaeota archaeon]|nr:MAG: GAF domain-containing protein [Candidatus Heimdallarchaeota archaeon]